MQMKLSETESALTTNKFNDAEGYFIAALDDWLNKRPNTVPGDGKDAPAIRGVQTGT